MSDAPILVTDQAVLTLLSQDDEIANAVDSAYTTLNPPAPASILTAWKNDLAAYQAFAADTRQQVSGGFFGGAWFGVPDMYNQAAAWGQRLQTYAADAKQRGSSLPPLPMTPAPVTAVTAPDVSSSMDTSTKVLLGLGLVTVLILAVKR